MRLDLFLVHKGLAPSRVKAKELIESGAVFLKKGSAWHPLVSPSQKMEMGSEVQVRENEILKYVSRGGLKLEGALRDFQISVRGKKAFDIGQSTGGFTDCLLKEGAALVVGVDVGHDQLHPSLKNHSQVKSFEGVHISKLAEHPEILNEAVVDLVVVDVSFISVLKVFEALERTHLKNCEWVVLVKPQFEVGASFLNKKGVVADPLKAEEVLSTLKQKIEDMNFKVRDIKPAKLKGTDGNQEFFFHIGHGLGTVSKM